MNAFSDPFAIEYIARKCLHCGADFQAMKAPLFVQNCCSDECTAAEIQKLGLNTTAPNPDRAAKWLKVCDAPRYSRFDASKLPADSSPKADLILRWRFSVRPERGVGIIGPSDRGKSMLIHELARLQFMEGHGVAVTSATDFAWRCGDIETRRGFIEKCNAVDVLLIDDIGKEKMTERVESDFYHVLEQRERQLLPILFTANAKGSQLAEKMTEDRADPILNRLRRMAEIFTL